MLFNARQSTKFMATVHEFWYRLTNGLVGGDILGIKILLLTTTGRKTGKRYTTPLLYLQDGGAFVVIASNGGADSDPDWWRNLRTHPIGLVQVGAAHKEVRAEATSGAVRDRLWSTITKRYPVYRGYQRRAHREIPVVLLHPEED